MTVENPSGLTTVIINSHFDPIAKKQTACSQPSNTIATDIAQGVNELPVQSLRRFPVTAIGSRCRSDWYVRTYKKYPWP